MNIKKWVKNIIKSIFSITPQDSDTKRREKILNFFLLIFGLLILITFFIPPVFIILRIPFNFQEGVAIIYLACLTLLVIMVVIILIRRYFSIHVANILFLITLTVIVIAVQTDINYFIYGAGIVWFYLLILLTSLLFTYKWTIASAFIIVIIIFIQHFIVGLAPNVTQLMGFIILSTITILTSRIMEKLLYSSKRNEENAKAAYKRSNLYRDLFSHDINNILQNIQGCIDLNSQYLHHPDYLDKISELLKIANQQVYRGANLVLNVRMLSEMEKLDYQLQKIDALLILKEAINNIQEQFKEKDIDIQLNSHTKTIFIDSNDLLTLLFENLLRNSIIHNRNSQIKISIEITEVQTDKERLLSFKFIDNGIGIPDPLKEKIFLRGVSMNEIEGTGLGLTLVSKIIDSYNGQIEVLDKVKGDHTQGSIFDVRIPASK